MRSIGSFQTDLATRFVDFLSVKSIPAKADRVSENKSIIWICNEDQVDLAKKELETFLANPNAEVYSIAAGEARKKEKEQEEKRAKMVRLKQEASRPAPFFHKTPLVLLVLVISVVIFFLGGSMRADSSINAGYYFCSAPTQISGVDSFLNLQASGEETISESVWFKSASIRSGHFWRLITPIFLHGDILHIVFNMIWLVIFGRMIEKREGTQFFFWLIIFSAIVSNSLQGLLPTWLAGSGLYKAVLMKSHSVVLMTPFGGFSGVVYAMFGFIWMRSTWTRVPEYQLSPLFIMIMMAMMMFGFIGVSSLVFDKNIANWAHGAGFFSGIVIGALAIGKSKEEV